MKAFLCDSSDYDASEASHRLKSNTRTDLFGQSGKRRTGFDRTDNIHFTPPSSLLSRNVFDVAGTVHSGNNTKTMICNDVWQYGIVVRCHRKAKKRVSLIMTII